MEHFFQGKTELFQFLLGLFFHTLTLDTTQVTFNKKNRRKLKKNIFNFKNMLF